MDSSIHNENGTEIFTLSGDVERGADCEGIKTTVGRIMDKQPRHVLMDLSSVDFVSSNFCSVLSFLYRKSVELNVKLVIIVPEGNVIREMIVVAGINRFIDLFETRLDFFKTQGI